MRPSLIEQSDRRGIGLPESAADRAPERVDGLRYLNVAEAAEYLRTSAARVREATRRNAVPTFQVGGQTLYDRADLDAYVHERKVEAAWRVAGMEGTVKAAGGAPAQAPSRDRVRSRADLEAVVARVRSGGSQPAELVGAFTEFERLCGGDWVVLDVLLRAEGDGRTPTHELWFDVGRAAVAAERPDLAAQVGRFVVDTSAPTGALACPAGHPPRVARGLHVLALATSGSDAASYAEMAADAYRFGRFAPPPDIYSLLAAWRRRRRVRVRRGLMSGLPDRLAWHGITFVTGDPDEHSAVLTTRDRSRIVTFDDVCMRDGRGTRPSRRWALLKVFAKERGRIRRPLGPGTAALEGLVDCLRQDLRIAFGLGGDPIPLVSDGGRKRAWQCRFRVEACEEPTILEMDLDE